MIKRQSSWFENWRSLTKLKPGGPAMGPPGYAVLWLADAAGRIALIQQLLPVSGKLLPVGRAHIRRAGAAGQMELLDLVFRM